MILSWLDANGEPGRRYTPYELSKAIGVSAGSGTAACKALVRDEKVIMYGSAPFMIGQK